MSSKPKRPIGITLLAGVFLWIGCLGSVLFPVFMISGLATDMVTQSMAGVGQSHAWLASRFGVHLLVFTWFLGYVAYACIGFGLWNLRNWARKTVVGLSIFGAVAGVLVAPFAGQPAAMAGAAIVGWVFPLAWLVWYLKRPRVCFAFGAGTPIPSGVLDSEPPAGMSRKGKILTGAALLTTFALFLCSLLYAVESIFRHSQIYQMTLSEAARSDCVAARIGTPFTPGWLAGGNMEESNVRGSAHLKIPVKGLRGKGDLVVSAEEQDGVWSISKLVLVQGNVETHLIPSTSSSTCH